MAGKIIIITAPSGSGKTTLVRRLLAACDELTFSISACTRSPRPVERDGHDYYFWDEDIFRKKIAEDAFVEWEMVYTGKYYGTLKSELERIWRLGKTPLVDIDVRGALAIQEKYPDESLTIFIEAPSLEALRARLLARGTETPHSLEERVSKATYELSFAAQFDKVIINDELDAASQALQATVLAFINQKIVA